MSMTATRTASATYTAVDIENVVRRVTADLVMIAGSTGAISEVDARNYGHDIELLAKAGYLKSVDATLFSGEVEVRAMRYEVNTESGNLTASRPGGALWPRVANPVLRIVIYYTDAYTDAARAGMSGKLLISWTPTTADTSHASLTANGGRDYVSKGFGMQRKDWAA